MINSRYDLKDIAFKLLQLFLVTIFCLLFTGVELKETLNSAIIAVLLSNWLFVKREV